MREIEKKKRHENKAIKAVKNGRSKRVERLRGYEFRVSFMVFGLFIDGIDLWSMEFGNYCVFIFNGRKSKKIGKIFNSE